MLKNHFKNILLVFALLFSIIGTQTCFGSQSDDLIQTGSVSINNTLGSRRQTLAQVQILYKIPANGFQNTLSISDFSNYNTANGLDLQLRGGRVGNSSILAISLILLQDSRWAKTIVWYIVSSRSDMWIGEWTENIYDLNAGSDSSSSLNTTVSSCICNWIPDNTLTSNYTVYVFISGIVTQLSKFNVSLNNIRFDKVKGSISTNLVDASKRIEQITFSYVVFLTPHPKFDLFSTNNQSFTRLNVPDYSFKGSIGFWQGVSNLTYTNWLIIDSKYSNCIGTCSSQCIGNTDCVNGKRGILQNRTCYICPAGTQADFKNKACSPICKANEEIVNGVCLCKLGTFKFNGECRQCTSGSASSSCVACKGAIQDVRIIYQGVTLSYIPPYFTADGCINCHKIVKVSVIKAQLIPSISITYLPTTKYRFLIKYDFRNAVFAIPKFTVTIRIDPVYSDKFTVQDMAQIYTITIDSALLAKKDPVENLTLEEILDDTSSIPKLTDNDVSKLFK